MASTLPSQPNVPPTPKRVQFSPTLVAILGSMAIAVVVASIITINPVTAFRMAYTNYAGEVPDSVAAQGNRDGGKASKSAH